MQRDCRSLVGLSFWVSRKYPQLKYPAGRCGQHNHNPSWGVFRAICYAWMHLAHHPYPIHQGDVLCRDLELSSPFKLPHGGHGSEFGLYYLADASVPGITGIIGMIAGASFDNVSQTQHCKQGESHTTEVHAAGTARNRLGYTRGLAQEYHIPQMDATPMCLDSSTTIFASLDDSAVKRALWLRNRIWVLRQGVRMKEFAPFKIPEADNAADVHTKYLPFPKWWKHVCFMNNLTEARMAKCIERLLKIRLVSE
jgi:hypothetical protein